MLLNWFESPPWLACELKSWRDPSRVEYFSQFQVKLHSRQIAWIFFGKMFLIHWKIAHDRTADNPPMCTSRTLLYFIRCQEVASANLQILNWLTSLSSFGQWKKRPNHAGRRAWLVQQILTSHSGSKLDLLHNSEKNVYRIHIENEKSLPKGEKPTRNNSTRKMHI